jgi:hypothetical protein
MIRQATFLVLLIFGVLCLPLTAAKPKKIPLRQTPFGTGAEAGHGFLKYHETCVLFTAVLISGDFFKDLYVYSTSNTVEFRRRNAKATYVSFPESLLVDVWAVTSDCRDIPPDYEKTLPASLPKDTTSLMAGASLKVAWKSADEIRPLGLLATQEQHDPFRFQWYYPVTVPSGNVPLTDSLIIDVSLRNGQCQTRLIANLDDRLRPMMSGTCD